MPMPWSWSAGGEFFERLEFLSDVLPGGFGVDQLRRLRHEPRTVIGFDIVEKGDARRQMEDALIGNGAGDWYAPFKADSSSLEAAWSIGAPDNVLSADTTGRRFEVGGLVLLLSPDGDPMVCDVGSIAAITDSTIELVDPPSHTWPARTLVIPLAPARLLGLPPLSRFTGDAVPASVQFRVITPPAVTEDAGEATYRSLPVFEFRPDWDADPVHQPDRLLGTWDAGAGPVSEYDLAGIALARQAYTVTILGRVQIAAFRRMLYAFGGRWGVFWLPSWAQDFRPVAGITPTGTTLDVAWTGISTRDLQTNRRDIRIELADGSILYRRITNAAPYGNGERLTVDAAFGVTASTAQIRSVSFLALARQDADVNLLRFFTFEVMYTDMAFRQVRADGI